jgi:hypothetical protein
MTLRRFEWLLRLHGPALAAWPDQDRHAALAFLRCSVPARLALADALARDDGGCEDALALARMQRGLNDAIAARQAPARLASGARWGALAVCALLGAWLGTAQAADQQAGERDPLQAISSLSPGSALGALQP